MWEKISDTFTEHWKAAGIGSSRSVTQIKEKWRALFERYKAIVDTSKKKRVVAENLSSSFKLWMDFLGALTKFTQNL